MDKLKSLIADIRRENKLDIDVIIDCLTNALIECEEDCDKSAYIDIYRKAYGDSITKDIAHNWVRSFRVTDNSGREHGEKWTMEQTTDVGNRMGVDWNNITKCDWYVVMNMEYSKHFETAKAYGNETDPIWFAHIAKDEWCNRDKSLFDYYIEFVL